MSSITEIRSILKYDKKQTTYKHALLRSLCDIVLMNPQVEPGPIGVAVPLRLMAFRHWGRGDSPGRDGDDGRGKAKGGHRV